MTSTQKRNERKNKEIRGQVSYFLTTEGYSKKELASALNMSISSLYNKLNQPSSFTLGEFRALLDMLKLTDKQLLEVV